MLNIDQQIFEQIKKANSILICFNKNWNGDAAASALAVYLFLKKLDKKIEVAADRPMSKPPLNFLPGLDAVADKLEGLRQFIVSLDIANTKVSRVKYKVEGDKLNFFITPETGFFKERDVSTKSGDFKYDLIISIDSPDLESLGNIYESNSDLFYQVPVINIDHQPANEEYGQINKIELMAVATSEILFNLFANYSREMIDEDIATCLLAGIISKTKSFKTPNITPQTLSTASQLIAMGGRREEIVTHLYRSRSLKVLKLWGRVLARLNSAYEDKLVWTALNRGDFVKTETSEEDLHEVIDELIVNIPSARVIVIIHEQETVKPKDNNGADKNTNVDSPVISYALIYSIRNINALDLAKDYNPTGNKTLARIELNKPVLEAEKEIIEKIKSQLEKLPL